MKRQWSGRWRTLTQFCWARLEHVLLLLGLLSVLLLSWQSVQLGQQSRLTLRNLADGQSRLMRASAVQKPYQLLYAEQTKQALPPALAVVEALRELLLNAGAESTLVRPETPRRLSLDDNEETKSISVSVLPLSFQGQWSHDGELPLVFATIDELAKHGLRLQECSIKRAASIKDKPSGLALQCTLEAWSFLEGVERQCLLMPALCPDMPVEDIPIDNKESSR